ncbi:MAG: transcriptional regulator [Thermoprotei archaeon]|nr:MAG: transcriptional regulator [Thermoprotei archaeon]RLF23980.1 MAG: transcriptional regulator [Thermoprotei archaeon]
MSFLPTPEDIRKMRLKAGLTQKELAERAGVSQSLIARIESGTVDPRLSTLRRILEALEEAMRAGVRARDVMHTPVIVVKADDPIRKAAELMWKYGISQIPVVDGDKVVGTVFEDSIMKAFLTNPEEDVNSWPVNRVMEDVLPMVSPDESLDTIMQILARGEPAVLVIDRGKVVGIITKSDVIAYRLELIETRRERQETIA